MKWGVCVHVTLELAVISVPLSLSVCRGWYGWVGSGVGDTLLAK